MEIGAVACFGFSMRNPDVATYLISKHFNCGVEGYMPYTCLNPTISKFYDVSSKPGPNEPDGQDYCLFTTEPSPVYLLG